MPTGSAFWVSSPEPLSALSQLGTKEENHPSGLRWIDADILNVLSPFEEDQEGWKNENISDLDKINHCHLLPKKGITQALPTVWMRIFGALMSHVNGSTRAHLWIRFFTHCLFQLLFFIFLLRIFKPILEPLLALRQSCGDVRGRYSFTT